MTSHGEIYSWVGASKFEDSGIDAVVHQGPISTGSFGAMLTIVFAQDPKTFQYRGTTQQDGHNVMEYSFQEVQSNSRYKVKTGDSWINSGYSGSVQVDPETNEVVRLTVETDELPPGAGTCRISSDMEFHMVRIGESAFPLPKQGRQRFVDINGDEVDNITTFGSCREYRGESTITFFPAPDNAGGGSPGSAAASPASIPAGLSFAFELTTPIAADTAAGGDPFSGRLVSALRVKGKTIAPAHALVEGRLLRVEMRRAAPPSATFVLKLRTVEVGGIKIPLAAVRDFKRLSLPGKRGTQLLLPNRWEGDSGVFQVRGEHAVMKAGTRTDWVPDSASFSGPPAYLLIDADFGVNDSGGNGMRDGAAGRRAGDHGARGGESGPDPGLAPAVCLHSKADPATGAEQWQNSPRRAAGIPGDAGCRRR